MTSSKNRRLAVPAPGGGVKLRIFHQAARGKRCPRYLIKCGCCDKSVEIYYSDADLEINGVNASLAEWRAVLLPLLAAERESP